ncbi:MAG: hypothetical protein WA858_10765, partial [Xanthobacteraceae bacterium]
DEDTQVNDLKKSHVASRRSTLNHARDGEIRMRAGLSPFGRGERGPKLDKLDKLMADRLHRDKAFARSLLEIQLSAVL